MPTLPLHQGWSRSRPMISSLVSCSCFRYSPRITPSLSPVPRDIDPDRGIAMAGEIGMGGEIALGRTVAPAIGDIPISPAPDRPRHRPGARSAPPVRAVGEAGWRHRRPSESRGELLDDTHIPSSSPVYESRRSRRKCPTGFRVL